MYNGGLESEVQSQVISYLKATPQAVLVLFFAFLEGHLWTFAIVAFVRKKTKGDQILKSVPARTAIGMSWIALSTVIIYAVKFSAWPSDISKIFSIVVPTLVLSLVLQLATLVGVFLMAGDRR